MNNNDDDDDAGPPTNKKVNKLPNGKPIISKTGGKPSNGSSESRTQ